jgi:hypothetical protein
MLDTGYWMLEGGETIKLLFEYGRERICRLAGNQPPATQLILDRCQKRINKIRKVRKKYYL